ncbi:hypothetical protein SYNPS1DRAFT_29876, partial [Syncephalis pseudoplumigaleata]
MKGMLRGKKKKEAAAEKDAPELCVDGQPCSTPTTPQAILDRRQTSSGGGGGVGHDDNYAAHRNSMFNMLLGRNKIINAITGNSLTTVSTAPSPLGSSAPASYSPAAHPTAIATTPATPTTPASPAVTTLVRRASNRLLNSTRFSSYETLRSTYNANDPMSHRFSRSTEDLAQEMALIDSADVYAGPLVPSTSDPGAYRNVQPSHDVDHTGEAGGIYARQQQQQQQQQQSTTHSHEHPSEEVAAGGNIPTITGGDPSTTHQPPNTNMSGYLAKKTDFRGGWKVYEACMRGGKLYFYKAASQATRHQVSDADGKGMALQVADFDPAASAFLFEPSPAAPLVTQYQFGLKVSELDVTTMRFRRYACVLLFEGRLVICRRKWVRSSRAQASAILLSEEDGANGYYTKWKVDDTYPIQHVEVMEAASTGFDSQSPMNETHPPVATSIHHATTSPAATATATTTAAATAATHGHTRTRSTSGDTANMPTQLGFQIFVASRDEVAAPSTSSTSSIIRLFVARTDEARRTFIRKLHEARQCWEARQHATSTEKKPEAVAPSSSSRTSTEVGGGSGGSRTRRFWGTGRHPELLVADVEQENDGDGNADARDAASTTEIKQYRVLGGSVDAMIHELIHQTARADEREADPDEFLRAFLACYHLFTDAVRLLQELG